MPNKTLRVYIYIYIYVYAKGRFRVSVYTLGECAFSMAFCTFRGAPPVVAARHRCWFFYIIGPKPETLNFLFASGLLTTACLTLHAQSSLQGLAGQ